MDTTENPPSDLSVRYSQPIGIVQEGQSCSIGQGHGIELSAVLPSEGVAQPVVVAQRIADGIVGNGCAVVLGQLIVSVNQ